METIKVKINGKEIDVPATMPDPLTGKPTPTTMLQACQLANVFVPHYCYHPKLPVAGNCRMCLVEYGLPVIGADRKPVLNPDGTPVIKKSPRPVIACATPVSAGMEIYTETETVKKMRQAVLEFLLLNHPLDCPICDQAGECKLQEFSLDFGSPESEFIETKVHKPKQVILGPTIVFDAERCILCTRCIRFTRDIVGDDSLGIINRGSYSTISTYPGKVFNNNYTLNTVDLCPVGALTSRDFRFNMRVWFLKETKSVCPSCGTGCNMLIGSRENRIYRLTPRENDFVNKCFMCDMGRLNYKWISREDRLKNPEIKNSDGASKETDWKSAIESVVGLLKQAGKGSVAIIASARQTNEELWLIRKLKDYLGALSDCVPRFETGDKILLSPDRNPNTKGAAILGVSAEQIGLNIPLIEEEIDSGKIKTLLVFNEDVAKSVFSEVVLSKIEKLVVVDVLPSKTAEMAAIRLPGCAYAEKYGTFTNVKGRVQKFNKAIEPPGNAKPEYQILSAILELLTGDKYPQTASALFNRMAAEVPQFQGMTWENLGDYGAIVKENPKGGDVR
jgi:NADH-quinone oxidoreductase subunit G